MLLGLTLLLQPLLELRLLGLFIPLLHLVLPQDLAVALPKDIGGRRRLHRLEGGCALGNAAQAR